MEWLVSSPPSLFNFESTPQVVGGPYQYGIAGARHAVIFAPEEVGGELREDTKRTIVIVANQTLTARTLLERIRERAAEGFWRFDIIVPRDGGNHGAAERRLAVALALLSEAGVEASGEVVEGDPVDAVRGVLEGESEVFEVMVSTYPSATSGWMRQDVIDRLRKVTRLPVTHVIVTAQEARTPVSGRAVRHVVTVAGEPMGSHELAEALRQRADQGPVRFTLVAPLDLPAPTWSDAARAAREGGIERVRATVDEMLESGVQVQGEVVDGDAIEAVRGALTVHRPDEILVAAYAGEPHAPDQDAVRRAARDVPVEFIVLEAEAPAQPSGTA
jgi:hypothetical protein